MPNHIFTNVSITGPDAVVDTIADLARNNKSILEHYLPLPESATEKRTGVSPEGEPIEYSVFTDDGYNTAIELWGSKWADYDVDLNDDGRLPDGLRYANIRCSSAWAPNTEGYRKLSGTLGIDVILSYEDDCGNYIGSDAIADGQVIHNSYIEGSGDDLDRRLALLGVPARPEDENAPDFAAREDEWQEQFSEAWNDLLTECSDRAYDALAEYRKTNPRVAA